MKKTSIYIAFAAAAVLVAVLAVSCVRELEYPRSVYGDRAVLRLTPVCIDPVTKADGDTEPADDTYNEKKIDGYYWFICDDAEGSNILLGGYTEGNVATERFIDSSFPIQNGNGWVYVIANLPVKPENPASGDEWFEFVEPTSTNTAGIKHVVQGGTTTTYTGNVSNLKRIPFGKNTPVVNNAIVAGRSEFYDYTSATTGVPAPERFVMRTEKPVPFTITSGSDTDVTVTAKLKRVAVKIILDLFVAEEVEQTKTLPTGVDDYVKTWFSDISHIQIYMLWGSTHGDLTGTPIHYSAEGDTSSWFYSASPRYAMYQNPTGGEYDFAGDSIKGSVPEALYTSVVKDIESTVWEVVYQRQWIWNDSVPVEERTINNQNDDHGHWGDYILDENGNKIPVVGPDGAVQRTPAIKTETKDYYQISSLPLYTMPISWNVYDAHAPFIKIILPWQGYDRKTDTYDTKNGKRKTTEFYYKILIPETTQLDANNCYHIELDLSVLGSSADEVPVEISGKYHVVPWAGREQMGGPQTAGRFLDVPSTLEFFTQSTMEIPVRSSHNIRVVTTDTTASYNNYSAQTVSRGHLREDAANTTGEYYTIAASGKDKVTIIHEQEKNLDLMQSRDVARIYYTFRVEHADFPSIYKDVTVIQYPSLYIEADVNSGYNPYGGNYQTGYTFVNNNNTFGGGWNIFWYNISGLTGSNANPNMYVVTSKILANTNQIIGDPRIQAGASPDSLYIIGFTGNAPGNGWATAPALNGPMNNQGRVINRKLSRGYLMAESSDRTMNMIAPGIRIASSFGATTECNFETAVHRCAAYQEDGRPAGRWRLPTAAEIQYLVNLSAKNLLPLLFGSETGSTTYWSANGTCTVSGAQVDIAEGNRTGTNYVRCVYDEWYWKDVLPNRNQFTWGDQYAN